MEVKFPYSDGIFPVNSFPLTKNWLKLERFDISRGNEPRSLLALRSRYRRFESRPRSVGMFPVSWLSRNSRNSKFGGNVRGIDPLNLLDNRSRCFNAVRVSRSSGMVPVRALRDSLTYFIRKDDPSSNRYPKSTSTVLGRVPVNSFSERVSSSRL